MDDTGQPKFHLKTINVNAQNKTLSTQHQSIWK